VRGAFLALWNGVQAAREPEYDRWHTLEHVPERVAVRGIHGARRYVDRSRAGHRYFTLYEADDLAAFDSADYLDLVRNPTPWSASMRPDLLDLVRAPCSVAWSQGFGMGGAIAVVCHDAADGDARRALAEVPGVVAVQCGVRQPGEATPAWRAGRDGPTRPFDRVTLVEALDRDAASRALRGAQRVLRLKDFADFGAAVYDLAYAFPAHDPSVRGRLRRPGWD
jgi:hypothetical protein